MKGFNKISHNFSNVDDKKSQFKFDDDVDEHTEEQHSSNDKKIKNNKSNELSQKEDRFYKNNRNTKSIEDSNVSEITDNIKNIKMKDNNNYHNDDDGYDYELNEKHHDDIKNKIFHDSSLDHNNHNNDTKRDNSQGKSWSNRRQRNGNKKYGNNRDNRNGRYGNNNNTNNDNSSINEYNSYLNDRRNNSDNRNTYNNGNNSNNRSNNNDNYSKKRQNRSNNNGVKEINNDDKNEINNEKSDKNKKIKTIDDMEIRNSYSISNYFGKQVKTPNNDNNPHFPDYSTIAGFMPNGRLRTLRDLWCPKNMPAIELAVEVEVEDKGIIKGDQSIRVKDTLRDSCNIILIPNHRIRLHVSNKLVYVERFLNGDTVELTNTRVPYIDEKDGWLKAKAVSKLSVKNVVLTNDHVQYIDIYAPSLHLFTAKYSKRTLNPSLITLSEDDISYQFLDLVDKDVDFSDDSNKEKAPYYIGVKNHSLSWDYDLDLNSIDTNLKAKHTFIYPSLDALKRLNVSKD